MRDEEENESFERGFERLFTVDDDDDGRENPPFCGDGDVVEGVAVGDEHSHDSGVDAEDAG